MPRAPRQDAAEPSRDRPVARDASVEAAPLSVPGQDTLAALMRSTPPLRTWGTGPPVTDGAQPKAQSGPTVAGQSRVVAALPPLRGVPAQGNGDGAPRP